MMTSRFARPRPRLALAPALFVLALCTAGAGAEPALGEACPGSGTAGACPYVAAQVIGQRAEGVLRFPEAVAVDAQGDVYVADQLSYVVQKFSAASGALEAEWGSYGGGHGQFGPIGGLAVDAAGNVYVVDSSHNRIEKFDSNGDFITDWGHHGHEPGEFSFGSSQNYTQPPGGGIAVAGNYVYVADSGNDRIERFNLTGGEPLTWGSHGNGPGEFSYPRGVAANEGEVIVSDDDNHRIERFDPSGDYEGEVGSYGSGAGQFGFPYGVALDAAGDVYVADDINHRIVKLNPQLGFAGAWGGFGSKPGQLAFPRALASDPAGDTYVADTANDRIEVFDANGNYLRAIGESARSPWVLTAPRGLAIDPSGRLLISDTVGDRIETFSPGGGSLTGAWTTTGGHRAGFRAPAGIAIDPRGLVLVADTGDQRIVRAWGDETFLSELAGPADVGGAGLSGAASLAVGAGGTIYVADTNHNRVLVYSAGGSLLARWGAGQGDGAAGGGPGEFNHPAAVAVDPEGNVYVADSNNNRIVRLAANGAVIGEWGSRGTGNGRFHDPDGVAVDAAGRVYVLDGENNRVEVFEADGRFLAKWGLRGSGVGELSQPGAIAVGCAGDVYVADTNNNRVERFLPAMPAGMGCVAPGDWPPPLDVAPVLHVSLARRAGVLARGALALAVRCNRNCRVRVSATLSPAGRRGRVQLASVARGLPAGAAGHVRLRVSAATLRRLRRELGGRVELTARVIVVAVGATGRRTAVTHIYAVSR